MSGDWSHRAPGSRSGTRPARTGRRGALTVCVLVCLVVITMITGVLLRIGLNERKRMRAEERRLQAEWLVESGLQRGAARLAASPRDYRGETWDIAAAELGRADAARVTIAVEPVAGAGSERTLHVQADYPHGVTERVRLSKRLVVTVEPGSPGETQ